MLPVEDAVKLKSIPTQIGLLFPATGATGVWFIVTLVVAAVLVQPLVVAVTEYVPEANVETLTIVGFCEVEVNPFGPLHE